MARIQVLGNRQFVVTLPRKLALALEYKKGDRVNFVINSKGRLELVKE